MRFISKILAKLHRNFRLLLFIFAIFLFNKFFLQPIFINDNEIDQNTKIELKYMKIINNGKKIISSTDNQTSNYCHIADDFKDYLSKVNFGVKYDHGICKDTDWVFIDDDGRLWFNTNYLNSNNMVITDSCHYSIINWKNDFSYEISSDKYPIENGTLLRDDAEFFIVSCKAKNDNSANLLEKVFGISYRSPFARIFKPKNKQNDDTNEILRDQEPLGVFMLGMDSISKLQWLENLPLSSEYLFKTLKSNVLNGYNVVGDGTPAALIALLTGKYEHELPNTLKNTENNDYVDKAFPFIWNNFTKELNYATLFGEDWPSIGTFTYRLTGMSAPPTLHYMRPFQLAIWEESFVRSSSKLCLNGRTRSGVMFDYALDFMRTYSNKGFFGLQFLSEYSHDKDNHVTWADNDLYKFLKSFHEQQLHKNTILILFSDHGPRFSDRRSTIKGLLEERNPFFSIYLPDRFRETYKKEYDTFINNLNSLTTPFDIHKTFLDTIKIQKSIDTNTPLILSSNSDDSKRSISLFQPISKSRTCKDAEIETHWCACLNRNEISINEETKQLANEFVNYINEKILADFTSKCAKLEVSSIIKAYLLEADKSLLPTSQQFKKKKRQVIDQMMDFIKKIRRPAFLEAVEVNKYYEQYQLQIVTMPNHALYEFTVIVERSLDDTNKYSIKIDEKSISRINKYGSQPQCIYDDYPELRKYCYCKSNSL